MTSPPDIRAVIAAAGTGRRAGLPYPKTLHPVLGKPILSRLLQTLATVDTEPAVIISPSGRAAIAQCLADHGLAAVLLEQDAPTGMGDAVLQVRQSPVHSGAEHILLVWGDIPLIDPATIAQTIAVHLAHGNDLTFPTRAVDSAYTIVERDAAGEVLSLIETRETGVEPCRGERDIGLFVFRAARVLEILDERPSGAIGRHTGEHGFLYVVKHLAERGYRVEALPIATENDLLSLNSLADLDAIAGQPSRP